MLANMCDCFFTYYIYIIESSLLLDYIHYETQFSPHFLTTSSPEKSPMSSPKSPNPNPDPINPAILLLKHPRVPCCKEKLAKAISLVVFG